jgi:beta-1,2-mannobiose phosphorylase / 1,2-beta-oligomannan phosphorylase
MIKFEKLGIIMHPRKDQFGSFARFNPGVLLKDDIVHMLYRATNSDIKDGANYISAIGYARLNTKTHILYDSNESVIFPTLPEESKGCEDPRIVEFEGSYYIFYTAFDGITARVAIAKTDDFVTYEKLGVINHFTWDKDAFIFPERINGLIAYLHRISPNIQLDYFESFDELLSLNAWTDYEHQIETSTIMKSEFLWENQKIGGSVPPIKTDKGWLLLYHAVDDEFIYRGSVALLDLENPSHVIARIPYPLLEPIEEYERIGDVNNVVFPEGGYVYEDDLYIYYGAADKYIAMAKINLTVLLNELDRYPTAPGKIVPLVERRKR